MKRKLIKLHNYLNEHHAEDFNRVKFQSIIVASQSLVTDTLEAEASHF